MTMKFYLFALFIALVAFGGTSFIMRDRQATATAAQPSLQSPNRPPAPAKKKLSAPTNAAWWASGSTLTFLSPV